MDIPETVDAGPITLQRWTLRRVGDTDAAINASRSELALTGQGWSMPARDDQPQYAAPVELGPITSPTEVVVRPGKGSA